MFDLRTAIRKALLDNGEWYAIIGPRIYQFNATPPSPKTPYSVVKLGVETAVGGWRKGPTEGNGQIWVHDEPQGDYSKIDTALKAARTALEAIPNQPGFFEARFLSDSQDYDDPALNTILRYGTYQFTLA